MLAVMLTKAQNYKDLDRDLEEWEKAYPTHQDYPNAKPSLILGSHELKYALVGAPLFEPDWHGGEIDKYDGIELVCLCDVWDQDAESLGCHEPMLRKEGST